MIDEVIVLVRANAPLLLFSVPLGAAVFAFVLPMPRASWFVAAIATLGAVVIASDAVMRHILGGAPFLSHLSQLAPDGLGLAGAAIVAWASMLCVFAAGAALNEQKKPAGAYTIVLSLCVGAGWCGALAARDFVGVFLGSELAWLSSLGLVALAGDRDRAAFNAAMRMLAVSGVGAPLCLVGIGLVAHSVGSLDLAALPLAHINSETPAIAGIVLVLFALAMKGAVAPLHAWAGAALGRSGNIAAMIIAGVTAVGSLAVIVRVTAFVAPAPALGVAVSAVLAALGSISLVFGSLQAIGARNLRRLIAYAAAAQAGGVLISAALGSPVGFAAALLQIAAMAASALALLGGFAASGCGPHLSALDGLGRRAPISGVAILIGALSLMGAPLTLSFLARWRVIEAAVGVEWWWAALLMIGASLAGVIYAGHLIERLYFRRAASVTPIRRDPWRLAMAPVLAVSVFVIVLGVEPSLLLRTAEAAARHLAAAPP